MIVVSGCTDIGCQREYNEDCILVDLTGQLFVVADGMGGERGGACASRLAVDTVRDYFSTPRTGGEQDWPFGYLHDLNLVQNRMLTAIKLANRAIRSRAEEDENLAGMGSTVAVVYVIGKKAVVGSVGDSRVYLWRTHLLTQVTRDDSFVYDLLEAGAITPEQAAIHPDRHKLLMAAGVQENIRIRRPEELELAAGDRLLMCSDGIHGVLDDTVLGKALSTAQDPEATVRYLVSRARRQGGPDNISCIIIDYDAGS